MPKLSSKIVITGIGVVSPLGIGCEDFAKGLACGTSVVHEPRMDGAENLPLRACSDLGDFDPRKLVKPRKSVKLMCHDVLSGVAAAQLAVSHAGLDIESVNSDRFGTVLGSEMLYGKPQELMDAYISSIHDGQFRTAEFGDHLADLFPLWMLKYLPNMPACHAAIAQQAFGANNSIVQGDASSLLALCEAVSVMERGWTDVMLAGGVGSTIQPVRIVNIDESLYSQCSDPTAACRPFDADRDGMVGGEGSGAFLLETEAHAAARGAKSWAVVAGFGRAFEPAGPLYEIRENGASGRATARAITLAMSDAGIQPADVDHVNAHGLSTVSSDRREALAIRETLGDVPVTAPKSFFGNLGAGGGAVEMAASVLGMSTGKIAPTLNFHRPDPECPVNVIAHEPKRFEKPAAIMLSQSSTGQSAAVVLLKA